MERPRKPKIDRMVPPSCEYSVNLFRGQKAKVTWPMNAHTVNAYGKAYELQTWYTDGARSAVTSKVKGEGRKVT